MHHTAESISFGPFCIDVATARLLREGADVDLRPQACHALQVLIQNSGQYVDYERMIHEAWNGTSVSKHTVAVTVGEVKKALGEYAGWITYRPKLGYRIEVPKSEDLIRRGWHCWNRRTREGLERALQCFQEAARLDAADFRPFEGISLCYITLATHSMRAPREAAGLFQEAHERAVSLAGLTPELRSDRAHGMQIFERRFSEAEADLLEALRERPTPQIYQRLAMLYTAMNRLDDALEAMVQARIADPLFPPLPALEGCVRFCRREFDMAVTCGREALDLHPYLQIGRVYYAQALEFAGPLEEAFQQYRLACVLCPDLPWLRVLEARCLARHGRRAEAKQIFEQMQQIRGKEYVDAYYMALLRDALGNRDEAFRELERAREENSIAMHILEVDPKADSLRSDPRFRAFRDSVFPPYLPLKAASAAHAKAAPFAPALVRR
jgi:tetratricopeptide (TPR) repeat protein